MYSKTRCTLNTRVVTKLLRTTPNIFFSVMYMESNPYASIYFCWIYIPGGVLDISLGGEELPRPSYPDPV